MSNLIPPSTVEIAQRKTPTCADLIEQVKKMKGFIGPNLLYKAEAHKELLQRVSGCFKDIIRNVNISLSIPNFMKSEAVLKNINCKKDLQKLKALCAHHLESPTKTTMPKHKIVRTLDLSKDEGFIEILDSKLFQATELVASSEPLMEELNKKVYLSKSGKNLMKKFDDITKCANGSFSDVIDHNKRRSMALKKIALRDIMKYDSFTSRKEEVKPRESFIIRQEYLETQITERLARTKEFESMSKVENVRNKIGPQFDTAFLQMTNVCTKGAAKGARQNADIKRLKAVYQKTVKRNIETDKELIRKKAKLLTLLSTWVRKYDTDVSLKMYTLDMVKEELQEQKDIAEKFFKEYNRISAEYSEVVQCQLVQERLEEFRAEVARKKAAKEKRGRK